MVQGLCLPHTKPKPYLPSLRCCPPRPLPTWATSAWSRKMAPSQAQGKIHSVSSSGLDVRAKRGKGQRRRREFGESFSLLQITVALYMHTHINHKRQQLIKIVAGERGSVGDLGSGHGVASDEHNDHSEVPSPP